MLAGKSNPDCEFEDMTSNDSGVESSTDNDDCAQPKFNKRLVSSAEMSLVPVQRMKNHDFPLSLCLNSISEPPIVFARPMINEIPGRKFKCLFELANPTFPGTLDRFQSCLTPIQEYTEMLLKMEKKGSYTQSKSNIGPCRAHSCRSYMRSNAFQSRDSHKLCRAANMNNTELLEQFLKNGVDPNCWDSRKRTPLHLAASKGYAEAVGLLLKYGANPNIKDALGNTPLHLAACTHHMDVVTLLLKGGTDVSSCDAQGRSPLHLAQSKLRLLTHCKSDVCTSVKQTVLQVIEMLLAYFDKKNSSDEAELLNAFQTRLQISDSGERVSTEIQDLLNNLSTLKLNK
ncbi:ankyrin repeat domain-containing protein 54-like [Melanaphis sacchari]|uniref:ankyrin repeat domain-containing protein 54-like n=1 Tax=Melanaphis sacchari TaxID=742174 RepID=UPI000DC1395D|nr:ankyrin repeat domain-containing protein 54-like [Melanaphis sacchari]